MFPTSSGLQMTKLVDVQIKLNETGKESKHESPMPLVSWSFGKSCKYASFT